MIRIFALLARRADLSREAFHAHYESHHVPMARALIPEYRHYVRNHVLESYGESEIGFDTLSEFGYSDLESFQIVAARMAAEAGAALRADELTFMDKSRNLFFRAHPLSASGNVDGLALPETLRVALLCRRPADWGSGDYSTAVEATLRPLFGTALAWEHWAAEPTATTKGRGRKTPYDTLSLVTWAKNAFDADALRDCPIEADQTQRLRVETRVSKRC